MAEIGNQIWSGRIVDAHYTNPEHDTVEILYRQVHPDEPSGTDADIKKELFEGDNIVIPKRDKGRRFNSEGKRE